MLRRKCDVLKFVSCVILLLTTALCEAEEGKISESIEDVVYNTPEPTNNFYLAESFDDINGYKARWVLSEAQKDDTDESIAKYNGEWALEAAAENPLRGDFGLVLKSQAKHHAISVKLNKPFFFDRKPFVLQYEVNFQNGQDCGGAYLKLLTEAKNLHLKSLNDKTPYTIMFGPDKCGNDHKLHFIFRHSNPKNGTITEKHCKSPTGKIEEFFKDKRPHLYTLVLKPDNTYEILVDNTIVNSGSLLEDFSPPVNPPTEIDDPDDRKPEDWDEREKIPDPDANKPVDWDENAPRQIEDPKAVKPEDWLDEEPESIADANAVRPEDWDNEMDGEWEAPLISNPKCENVGCGEWKAPMVDNPSYKGKWFPPTIDNPNYKGKWKPRKIPNPDFFEDRNPFRMKPIGAVGLELWSMSNGIYFDNLIITDDRNAASKWAKESFELKQKKNDQDGLFNRILKYTNSNPWLWAVYVVVVALPIVLIVVFCCSSEDKSAKVEVGKAKKKDISRPDDVPTQEEREESVEPEVQVEDDEEEDEGAAGDVVADENEEDEEAQDVNAEAEEEPEVEEEPEEVEEEPVETQPEEPKPGRSPRRRRTRKD